MASHTAHTLPIADVRYLWSEVERLKAQVQQLQQSERQSHDEQHRLRDYVASFVTQAQLDAALCTKISQSSVASSVDRLRAELLDQLEKKADVGAVQAMQSKKLDISVYESSTWDLKKFRTALEQSVHDLFAQFAHQIEAQVNGKLSLDDFDRIFNPDANGQKAAIETAAARIARMNDQLESLQEYVHSDRQRQHKVADLNVSLLDLTRKHNASRNSIAQLFSAFEAAKERTNTIESDSQRVCEQFTALVADVEAFHAKVQSESTRQQHSVTAMAVEVESLAKLGQQTTQTLAQIQQFTQHTLLKGLDTKLAQMQASTDRALAEAGDEQRQFRQHTAQQVAKTTDRVVQILEQHAAMETRLHRVESTVAGVRDELGEVKGPLLTVARNLREENVAILEEIRRSQDDSRGILIDYKGLLEKTDSRQHPMLAAPARPVSSSSSSASRKHRQQQLLGLAARIEDSNSNSSKGVTSARPQTSSGRLGLRARTASSRVESSSVVAEPVLAQRPRSEAGPRPKKSLLYSIATAGGSEAADAPPLQPTDPATTDEELFTFPPAATR